MDPVEARIRRARSISSPADAAVVYRHWAATYDDDVFGDAGFTGSDRIAELLAEHWAGGPVVDLGCGTGAVGVRFGDLGVSPVDGIDLSPEMLAVAAAKGAYRGLIAADLGRPLPVADGVYDAAVSAGTFTAGHVGPAAVPGILRALRPGAVVAWVIGTWGAFAPVVETWDVLHLAEEPIRRDGPPEAMMLVARVPADVQR